MDKNLSNEVNESLKLVFDITSRIDERMKALIQSNNESKERIEKLYDQHMALFNRITVLENKNNISDLQNEVNALEDKVASLSESLLHIEKDVAQNTNRWATIIDLVFKIGIIVIGGIILWKMGIKP